MNRKEASFILNVTYVSLLYCLFDKKWFLLIFSIQCCLIFPISSRSADASAKDIKVKHRKLMMLNHPDRGGSKFLATKVNAGIIVVFIVTLLLLLFVCKCLICQVEINKFFTPFVAADFLTKGK
jgi:hypothetical protein